VIEMKYGVIVCPKCGKARGIETKKKTTSCQCGREIVLSKIRFEFTTDSPLELADAVAQANEQLAGGEKLKLEKRHGKKSPYSKLAESAKVIKDPMERMRLIALHLTELKGDFLLEDVRQVTSLMGKDSPEDVIARLKEHNLIYETADGKFRYV
jgi:hypothetical protein